MRKKLLAGVMALALCSTNMLPQTIFAGEFTSGNSEEVSEVFTDTNQESAEEELSVFASESVPEFSSETNIAPATTDGTESTIDIDLTNPTNSKYYNSEMSRWEIFDNGSYRFKGSDDINSPTNASIYIHTRNEINIYLNNVNIVADLVPALEIQSVDNVNIYLENNNFLKTKNPQQNLSTLMIGPFSFPTINNSPNNSGSLTVYSEQYPAINTKRLTINGGSVTASSTSGTGIESDSLTIKGGSVKASSQSGTGIKSDSLTIKGGSVTAYSANKQEKGISSNQITINGGSVKASSVSSSPKNTQGDDVYCCTIENPKSEAVIIDRNPTSWEPKNHQAVDPLYAWLTGETHTISVGNTTQTYYFDKNNNNNEFKPITNRNFTFTKPSNLTYDGTAQKAPLKCNIEDIKDEIKLSYYNKDDGQQSDEAINAGTYTVTANIAGNIFADESWTFTIKPRNLNISINDIERKYGENNPELTYLISPNTPLVANDTTDILGITLTTTANKDTAANTTWPITMYYTTKNYTINATPGKLTIKPATFNENSIKITAYSGTYDG
ncbi:carbohydrate-binding domain-containing protein, partial [Blautia wexlerae]